MKDYLWVSDDGVDSKAYLDVRRVINIDKGAVKPKGSIEIVVKNLNFNDEI
jgi:hypothetical protein